MKNLVLLGAPGSGKGTQSAKLVAEKGYTHISTGNLLRAEIAKESELGIKVKEVMESGQLVSDDLVVELLKANLDLDNSAYIFDGYPRNIEQAKTLNSILEGYPSLAVYFELDTDKLVERLTNRRVTKDGKHIYNLVTNPPKVSGVCDVSGEPLVQRDDDKEEVVRSRMEVFENTINPVLDLYESKGKLVRLQADQSMDKVFSDLVSKIN
ncbi:MAG: adenylate kinase [Halobacteriovoraceae bacterium]|nr:adenylate kinase [Halobacteriovoraceae bacterium]|tara:strand:- start:2185 stop:2814 length:630 start_codon:yes stop_codon:yes gene_type:complete